MKWKPSIQKGDMEARRDKESNLKFSFFLSGNWCSDGFPPGQQVDGHRVTVPRNMKIELKWRRPLSKPYFYILFLY